MHMHMHMHVHMHSQTRTQPPDRPSSQAYHADIRASHEHTERRASVSVDSVAPGTTLGPPKLRPKPPFRRTDAALSTSGPLGTVRQWPRPP